MPHPPPTERQRATAGGGGMHERPVRKLVAMPPPAWAPVGAAPLVSPPPSLAAVRRPRQGGSDRGTGTSSSAAPDRPRRRRALQLRLGRQHQPVPQHRQRPSAPRRPASRNIAPARIAARSSPAQQDRHRRARACAPKPGLDVHACAARQVQQVGLHAGFALWCRGPSPRQRGMTVWSSMIVEIHGFELARVENPTLPNCWITCNSSSKLG